MWHNRKPVHRHGRRLRLERLEERTVPTLTGVGSMILVNSITAGVNETPVVACDADGDFVVVWTNHDGSQSDVMMRRYARDGIPLDSGDVRVHVASADDQHSPAVAMDADGDFVVAWLTEGSIGDVVSARRFTAVGVAGPEFRVDPGDSLDSAFQPAVAMDVDGDFVVSWSRDILVGVNDRDLRVFARAYSANGQSGGPQFVVNSDSTREHGYSQVAMDADGDFVVIWQSGTRFGPDITFNEISARRYDRTATPLGNQFRVNAGAQALNDSPTIGIDAAGNFFAAWRSGAPFSQTDVLGRRFGADGVPLDASDILIAANTSFFEYSPALAHNARDLLAVAFQTRSPTGHRVNQVNPGDDSGAFMGTLAGPPSDSTGALAPPELAMDARGNAVMVWSGPIAGGELRILALRYAESEDTVGPWITSVSHAGDEIEEGERIQTAPTSIRVAFSENMTVTGGATGLNSVTNPNNWRLTRNGTVLNSIASINYGFDWATRKFVATLTLTNPLAAGEYTLGTFQSTSFTGMRDLATNSVDGDFNGVPGTNFVRSFRVGHPQVVGFESPVSSTTIGIQQDPRIGFDAAGNSVVVWQSNEVGPNNFDIYARRFSNTGVPLGNAFRVNDFLTGVQSVPAVAVADDGRFVVTWTSAGQDPDGSSGVYAKRFTAAGSGGSEFRVNSFTTNAQRSPSIASSASGEFVITWESVNQDGSTEGVYAQLYTANGNANGGEFRVNTVTANSQRQPSVAMDPDGDFVVAFTGQDGSGSGIFLRRFANNGTPIDAADVPVNSVTGGPQEAPAVAIDRDGDFVVTWQSADPVTDLSFDIRAKLYTAAGGAGGDSFPINEIRIGEQLRPRVALDADGDYVITWEGNHTGQYDIYGLRFDPAGNSATSEFQVNTVTTGTQSNSAIGMTPAGDFAVVWTNSGGASPSPAMRRFAVVAPSVASVRVNDGSQQRSRVTSLTVAFNTQVTFAGAVANAFTLMRNGGGAVGFTATASLVNGITVVTLNNFTGSDTQFASLRDGRYTLTVLANQVSANAMQMAGNFAFGDAQGLFRMYGDINGDRQVDGVDFSAFSSTYALTSSNPNFIAAFDVNGDGAIDGFDFSQFSGRVFTVLP